MASALSSDIPWLAGLALVTRRVSWTKMAKPAPPSLFTDTDPSVHKWMSAGGRAVSVQVAAMIQADGMTMLSWWSSTSNPKWILDRSVHGGGPEVVSSTKAVSMPACLAMSSAVLSQLVFLPGRWAWDLVCHPESPHCVISSNHLAACAMGVSWRWWRVLLCNLVVAISAWSASLSKSDSHEGCNWHRLVATCYDMCTSPVLCLKFHDSVTR